jgi:hypothetical protein
MSSKFSKVGQIKRKVERREEKKARKKLNNGRSERKKKVGKEIELITKKEVGKIEIKTTIKKRQKIKGDVPQLDECALAVL